MHISVTIKNLSHCWWLETGDAIQSPSFTADSLQDTKWSLSLYPMGSIHVHSMGFYLERKEDCSRPDIFEAKYQLAFLDKDGSILNQETESASFVKEDFWGYKNFESRERILITERESFLPEDTLTVQCTIWNKKEKPVKSKHIYAQTVFKANRRSLVLRFDKFSSGESFSRNKFKDGLLDLDLILNEGIDFEKEIVITMNSFDDCMKYFSLATSIIDSEGKKENCGMKEFFAYDLKKGELSFMLKFPENFMEDQNLYLPNDVLYLNCELVFSTETILYESFGSGISTALQSGAVENKNEPYVEKEKSQNISALAYDLKSMYNDRIFIDMELRTSTRTYPAHRNILSARSPVFREMFSNDMANSGYVNINDLEDEVLCRMLKYIYTDVLEDLQFESASKLYTAAVIYKIFSLKSKCSSFLQDNLCPTKACDILTLADQHQDEDLKNAVQDYILGHEEVFSTKEWVYFMETNVKLAADIMYRKIKPGKIQP